MTEKKIDAAGASAYFANKTTRAAQWSRWSKEQKAAAVEEASALYASEFGAPPNPENERDAEGIYEQALYLLSRYSIPTVSGSESPTLNGPETDAELLSASESNYGMWSTLALSRFGKLRVVARNSVG